MHRLELFHNRKLRVHPFALSGLFLILFVAKRIYAFAVLSSVILHELGHLIASLLYHKRPEYIELMPTGISIGLAPPSSYIEEIVIAAAGPLMNLLYIAAASFFPSQLSETIKLVSLLLCFLNLLPLGDFDGGRILRAVLSLLLEETISFRISQFITTICLAILWVLSLYIFFYSGVNMTLLIFCAYLFSYLILKRSCHDEVNMLK